MVRVEDFIQAKIPMIPDKSDQEIYDTVCRRMISQRMPALLLKESPLDTPTESDSFLLKKQPSDWSVVMLDSKGSINPLYVFFTPQDMRILYREFGFGKIQEYNDIEVHYYLRDSSENQNEYRYPLAHKIVKLLDHRGIRGKDSIFRLLSLGVAHEDWGGQVRHAIDSPLFDNRPDLLHAASMSFMGPRFDRTGAQFGLNRKVLAAFV